MAWIASLSCGGEIQESSTETEASPLAAAESCAPGGDRFYQHPLQGLKPLPDGRLPFIDAKRSPRGMAYVLGEEFAAQSEGETQKRIVSGVFEAETRTMTKAELAAKPPRVRSARRFDKLDVALRDRLAAAAATGSAERVPVHVYLERRRAGTITQRIDRAIAEGRVQSYAERSAVRDVEMAALAKEIAVQVSELADRVKELGGEIRYRCTYAPCLRADLTPDQIGALAKLDSVQRIGSLEESHPDALDGNEKADVYQTRMFWDQTFNDSGLYEFDGNNGQDTDIRVAVLDDEGFRTTHVAFREDSGTGTRIDSMWDCRSPPCSSVSSFSSILDHGTSVLGTLLGDYRDGQDPSVNTAFDRNERSASGGEAKAYLYWADRSTGDQQAVYDNVVNRSPAPHLLVSSNSVGAPTDCSGEDSKAVGADNVYEAGIAYFKSANQTPGSASDCTVGPPGEAIGVFTVAGFNDPSTGICDSRNAAIHASSSWGGSTTDFNEGKFRSIIALTGSYQGSNIPQFTGDDDLGPFSGTSHANPSVASAAINLIDQMKNFQQTNFIDDPGVIYAWMLNMGDRRLPTGAKMSSRYDRRTGAGNIKMRFIGDPGLDSPYHWGHFSVCVANGQAVSININGGARLSVDVDSVRAVAWWYDRRIENGTDIDDIDLRLKTVAGTTLRTSNDAWDNKERIFFTGMGGEAIKLELTGVDVTSDVEGCGSNSMRVFVTYLAEDHDRDDLDGPDYNTTTCVGVENL